MILSQRRGTSDRAWNAELCQLLELTRSVYGDPTDRNECFGVDLRPTSSFVRQEVIGAHRCLTLCDAERTLGFCLVKKKGSRNATYVTLIVSFQRGVGRRLISHIANDPNEGTRFIVVRSTPRALGFYLHMGFTLFDYLALDAYVADSDIELTGRLLKAMEASDKAAMRSIRETLVMRNWIDATFDEWPLLIRRELSNFQAFRRSDRLRRREESQLLRPATGRSSSEEGTARYVDRSEEPAPAPHR